MSPWVVLLVCVLAAASAFLSGAEIALFSLSRFQLRSLKDNAPLANKVIHRRIKHLLSDPAGLLVTILVVNEVLNVSMASLITGALSRIQGVSEFCIRLGLPEWLGQTLLGTAVTTPIVLIFCEVTPKAIAAHANQAVASLTSGPLNLLYWLFRPIRMAFKQINRTGSPKTEKVLREEEFLVMLEEGHKEGAIHETELDLIKNVFELDDTRAQEVMTPVNRVFSLPSGMAITEALHLTRTHSLSRIPIYQGQRRNIIGVLYKKDLLLTRLDPDVSNLKVDDLMRKPQVILATMKLNGVFRKLKQTRNHIAIVEDKNGDALGIVTMHDVLDELFDDLLAEADEVSKTQVQRP